MEQIIIEVDEGKYSVEFKEDGHWFDGNVYPITEWEKPQTGEKGWGYDSKTSGGTIHDEFNEDCRIMFGFLFCWRGVWEGRIYFKDDEYWSEELRACADLWDKIEPILKQKIQEKDPNMEYGI